MQNFFIDIIVGRWKINFKIKIKDMCAVGLERRESKRNGLSESNVYAIVIIR